MCRWPCGDPASRHGIILAKNEPAKRFGIQTAETVWQARRKCPSLLCSCRRTTSSTANIPSASTSSTASTADLVEPFGIDESWLDITGSMHLFGGDPVAIADELRCRVREELGLSISVGVSFNKIFAKLCSDYKARRDDAYLAGELAGNRLVAPGGGDALRRALGAAHACPVRRGDDRPARRLPPGDDRATAR